MKKYPIFEYFNQGWHENFGVFGYTKPEADPLKEKANHRMHFSKKNLI